MAARTRNLKRKFPAVAQLSKKNILVNGCSFTFNNSDIAATAWPYYIKDYTNADDVYDCSQPGAGSNHIFSSTICELESNNKINPDNTFIIIMWSSLSRVDLIANTELVNNWHTNYYTYNSHLATASLSALSKKHHVLKDLSQLYFRAIDTESQIIESCSRIIALSSYLEKRNYSYLFTSWKDPVEIDDKLPLYEHARELITPITSLGKYAGARVELDDHPTQQAHQDWAKNILLPYLIDNNLAFAFNSN